MDWFTRQQQERANTSPVKTGVAVKNGRTSTAGSGDYAVWQAACKQDWDALKAIPVDPDGTHTTRNRAKVKVLDKYRGYLGDWAYQNREKPYQNDVLVRCLVWAMDTRDWMFGLILADDCVATNQTMTLMERTCATFAADAVLQAAETDFKTGKLGDVHKHIFNEILDRLLMPTAVWQTNTYVLAKYCRLKAKIEKDSDPTTALQYAEQADLLDCTVGVKGLILELKKKLDAMSPLTQAACTVATTGKCNSSPAAAPEHV